MLEFWYIERGNIDYVKLRGGGGERGAGVNKVHLLVFAHILYLLYYLLVFAHIWAK